MPMPMKTEATEDDATVRFLKRRSGMSASSPMARSMRKNATSPARPMA